MSRQIELLAAKLKLHSYPQNGGMLYNQKVNYQLKRGAIFTMKYINHAKHKRLIRANREIHIRLQLC